MPAVSPVKKESVGLGAVEWVQKKTRLQKQEDCVHGNATKKLKHTVIQKFFFLEILINVKASRVNSGARKYIAGAALDRPVLLSSLPNVRGSYWDSL
jgi:hypothetical protein